MPQQPSPDVSRLFHGAADDGKLLARRGAQNVQQCHRSLALRRWRSGARARGRQDGALQYREICGRQSSELGEACLHRWFFDDRRVLDGDRGVRPARTTSTVDDIPPEPHVPVHDLAVVAQPAD
jgi:hypothetical protein